MRPLPRYSYWTEYCTYGSTPITKEPPGKPCLKRVSSASSIFSFPPTIAKATEGDSQNSRVSLLGSSDAGRVPFVARHADRIIHPIAKPAFRRYSAFIITSTGRVTSQGRNRGFPCAAVLPVGRPDEADLVPLSLPLPSLLDYS